jgi:hypothetical protein
MAKLKKRRLVEEALVDQNEVTEKHGVDSKKKSKRSTDDAAEHKRTKLKEGKSGKGTNHPPLQLGVSPRIHLDSLQSMFATKDEADTTFTLFGGDPVSEPSIQEGLPSAVHHSLPDATSGSEKPEARRLYFFPYFSSPKKSAQSLFPSPTEPFFHHRLEYEFCLYV